MRESQGRAAASYEASTCRQVGEPPGIPGGSLAFPAPVIQTDPWEGDERGEGMSAPAEWKGSDLRSRGEIVRYLKLHGGEIVDPVGLVVGVPERPRRAPPTRSPGTDCDAANGGSPTWRRSSQRRRPGNGKRSTGSWRRRSTLPPWRRSCPRCGPRSPSDQSAGRSSWRTPYGPRTEPCWSASCGRCPRRRRPNNNVEKPLRFAKFLGVLRFCAKRNGWRGRGRTFNLLGQGQAFCRLNYPPSGGYQRCRPGASKGDTQRGGGIGGRIARAPRSGGRPGPAGVTASDGPSPGCGCEPGAVGSGGDGAPGAAGAPPGSVASAGPVSGWICPPIRWTAAWSWSTIEGSAVSGRITVSCTKPSVPRGRCRLCGIDQDERPHTHAKGVSEAWFIDPETGEHYPRPHDRTDEAPSDDGSENPL